MSKVYILEPTEVAFDNHGEASIENANASKMFNAITEETIVTAFDKTLKYAGTGNQYKKFTTDGTMETSEDSINIGFNDSPGSSVRLTFFSPQVGETTTVSIYNVTEDPVINPFTKNVTHVDHPYNAVERIRAKLKQKIDEGEEESGGDEGGETTSGGGIFLVNAEIDETAGTATLNKTYKEIVDAFEGGSLPVMIYPNSTSTYYIYIFIAYGIMGGVCSVGFYSDPGSIWFNCDTENDYPVADIGG